MQVVPYKKPCCCGEGGDCSGGCYTCTTTLSTSGTSFQYGDVLATDIASFISALNADGITTVVTSGSILGAGTCGTLIQDGQVNYREYAVPQFSSHDSVPISGVNPSDPSSPDYLSIVDSNGLPETVYPIQNAGTTPFYTKVGTDGSGDLVIYDGYLIFPEPAGTPITVRANRDIVSETGAWVVSPDTNPANWIDPTDNTGAPLLDMDNTLGYVGPTTGWNTPPIGSGDRNTIPSNRSNMEAWTVDMTVDPNGHWFKYWMLDPWVAWNPKQFEYSTDGGATWQVLSDSNMSSQTSCVHTGPTPTVDILFYSCGVDDEMIVDGSPVSTNCAVGVDPFVCDIQYSGVWSDSLTACQQFEIESISGGLSPYQVSLDGGVSFSSTAPFVIDQPKNGVVQLMITDGNGCQVFETVTNHIDVSANLLNTNGEVPSNIFVQTGNTAETTLTNVNGAIATHITMQATTVGSGAGAEMQILTNEFIYMRRGTAASPNIVEFDFNPANDPIPLQHAPCVPDVIDWGIELEDVSHALQPADTLRVYIEFYDGATLLEKRQVYEVFDDFGGNSVQSGSEAPPANTDGVKMVVESDTQGSTRQHRIDLGLNTYVRQA